VGACAPGAGLGGTTTHFIQTLKNAFLAEMYLGQNMLKNAYFFGKKL